MSAFGAFGGDAVQTASAPVVAAKSTPNVLIIGDSIPLGYMATVAVGQAGHPPPANERQTDLGVDDLLHHRPQAQEWQRCDLQRDRRQDHDEVRRADR